MELAKSSLFHRKDKSNNSSLNSPNSNKLMEENRLLDPLKSQEHIYTYDTDKHKRSVPNTPGRKHFKIVCMVMGVIAIYLFGFSLFLNIRGGYSGKNLNDINSNCRYAMLILSLFVMFAAITGYSGAYTNWKPIILTFSVLAFMGLLGHLYVAKKFLDAVRFAERDLAISWWDVYWDSTRRSIQDEYKCCGYKAYNDLPVVSEFCSLRDVYQVTLYDSKIKDPADVERNDSYKKHFRGADSVVDDDGDGGAAKTTDTKPVADAGGAGAAGNAGGAGAAGNVGGVDDAGNAGGVDAGGAGAAGNIGGAGAADGAGAAGNAGNAGGAGNAGNAGGAGGAKAVGNKQRVGAGNVGGIGAGLKRRQDTLVPDPTIMQAPGCKEHLVPLVKGKLKLVYLFNYALCTVYFGAIALSLFYWQNMRKEKEFDEFA